MTNGTGITFPYKLWDLINSPSKNGIEWCKKGQKIIIDKKLFEKKCLHKGKFKTKKLISIAKQLNVYGFVACINRRTDKYLIYKNKYFKKDREELLLKFSRKFQHKVGDYASSADDENSLEDSNDNKKAPSRLETARMNFRLVLLENVKRVQRLPTQLTPPESENDDEKAFNTREFSKRPILNPVPNRQDPRTLMWNGSSVNAYRQFFHALPYPVPEYPTISCPEPVDTDSNCSNELQDYVNSEDADQFDFPSGLEDIFLSKEFKYIYSDIMNSNF